MIIFCEECGARNDLRLDKLGEHLHTFECTECCQRLMVSKPSMGEGGLNAFVEMALDCGAHHLPQSPVSVLIVDDSALLRKILKEMFAADDQVKVVGEAEHGLKALEMIPELKPDVVTLDVNMPVMDGLTTIKHIMIKCPTPVVMFSSLTGQGSLETFESLRYGAVDFLQKPSSLQKEDLKSQHDLIVSRVKNAARAGIDTIRYLRPAKVAHEKKTIGTKECHRVFAIGSSYGGYGSLLGLIPEIKPQLPAAFISVLYAAAPHVDAFVGYLDQHSQMTVRRAVDGAPLQSGVCYLASAFEQVEIKNGSGELSIHLQPKNIESPGQASDTLMASLSDTLKDRASGILLSGIGKDGIAGIGAILKGGGNAIIQDPRTCLCNDTTAMTAKQYGLSAVLPGTTMAEAIQRHCLDTSQ
ncbi:chemotaxis protein CheB [Desulfosarcina sp.]|uniref:chemotaxis protein CheB n=1 Tax=Desulfosarcina sp. TaxID=2027861 RepID=UPI003565EEA8